MCFKKHPNIIRIKIWKEKIWDYNKDKELKLTHYTVEQSEWFIFGYTTFIHSYNASSLQGAKNWIRYLYGKNYKYKIVKEAEQ